MVVRCRPMSRKETEDNRQKVVEMDKHRGCVRDRCLWRVRSRITITTRACGVAGNPAQRRRIGRAPEDLHFRPGLR